MATTAPQLGTVRPQRTPCTGRPARRQATALRELAVTKPYGFVQAKLTVGPANDRFEQEADAVADRVMRMEDLSATGRPSMAPPGHAGPIQRLCANCEEDLAAGQGGREKSNRIRAKAESTTSAQPLDPLVSSDIEAMRGGGQPLPLTERAFFEPRFGYGFSAVRVHTDSRAAASARAVSALAFTSGHDIVFGTGQYAPGTKDGRHLLAHELTHVVQQEQATEGPGRSANEFTRVGQPRVQRGLGDGHDLSSPRFERLIELEEAFDNERVIRVGSTGRAVQAIQQALYDLGFALPGFGADGDFGAETRTAVEAFQAANPPLVADGVVGPSTMAVLDTRFAMPSLPSAAARATRWDRDVPRYSCVLNTLCPWSPHTVDVIRTRITLKSFDLISWADEEWNGVDWIPAPFPGGGYNTGTEIGVLNSSCETMAETLYHEVLHAEQPTSQTTTLEKRVLRIPHW